MDDFVEIHEGNEDEDYDPAERTEMLYDESQRYIMKMYEDV